MAADIISLTLILDGQKTARPANTDPVEKKLISEVDAEIKQLIVSLASYTDCYHPYRY